MTKRFTTWVWSDTKGDWRAVKSKLPWQKESRSSYKEWVATRLQKREKNRGRIVTTRDASTGKPKRPPKGKRFDNGYDRKWALINTWLTGDLDAKVDLMYRLAKVARGLGKRLYLAEGTRSIADQWKYWIAYKAGRGPLAAFPGTSKHTYGDAADVREGEARGTRNIGDIPGARTLMKKYDLCLPVPGEPWHVERGNNWRA